jgi:hypothetical protein
MLQRGERFCLLYPPVLSTESFLPLKAIRKFRLRVGHRGGGIVGNSSSIADQLEGSLTCASAPPRLRPVGIPLGDPRGIFASQHRDGSNGSGVGIDVWDRLRTVEVNSSGLHG